MMLKFKTYMSDRSRLLKLGEVSRELARKTEDPQKFILDFAEERFPHLYEPLLEAFYLEADAVPGPTVAAAGEKPATDAAASTKGDAARPPGEVPHGGILDWLKDLFSGGGAAKNFDKALTSMTKVASVVKTIKIPEDLQQTKGSGVEGYDEFSKELDGVLSTMKNLSEKSRMLQVADAIKRDPNYVQELEGQLAGLKGDEELAPIPKEDDGTAGGTGGGGTGGGGTGGGGTGGGGTGGGGTGGGYGGDPDATDPKVVSDAIHAANTGAAGHDPEIKKILDTHPSSGDKAADDKAKWEKVGRYLADKHRKEMDTSRDHYHRRGNVISENFFADALVLAGIPTTRRRRK